MTTKELIAVTDQICEGVFFTTPEPLPRGRHELDRAQVQDRQRERLMIAVAEVMAAGGYRSMGVREIASHAQISRAAFYECFTDKDQCVFAAYGRFIDILLERVAGALDGPVTWDDTVVGVVEAYLSTMTADLVVARAFQVEMDALGRPARERRREALTFMAQVLKARRDERWPGAESLPLSAYVGAVYAVRQLASDLLDDLGNPDLTSLAREAGPWLGSMLAPVSLASRHTAGAVAHAT